MPRISVVMPCLNEEKSIGICIKKINVVFTEKNISGEIIVSDNGSGDSSMEIAEKLGAKIVVQPVRGYGAAYIKGLNQAKGEYIIMADSDNTYDFFEMPKFIQALELGSDFVMGSRFGGEMENGSMKPLHKYIGNPLLNFCFNFLYGTNLSDTHCGYRAFTKKAYKKLKLSQKGMEFALEMIVNASKNNLKISEVPVNYYRRQSPSKLDSFKDGFSHMAFMIGERLK